MSEKYVKFMGRLVLEGGFRAWMYSPNGESKVADSYAEYLEMSKSGLWFESKELAAKAKAKNGKNK